MNVAEFNEQIHRLRDNFGERAFSDEKCKLIWGKVGGVESFGVSQFVTRAISERKHTDPPQVKDFSGLAGRSGGGSSAVCSYCEGSGWTIVESTSGLGVPVSRRCECVGGPAALAAYLRNPGDGSLADPDLADRIERQA